MRHRDDEYAHEVFKHAPFDGVLVSKAVLDSGPLQPWRRSTGCYEAEFGTSSGYPTRHCKRWVTVERLPMFVRTTPPFSVAEVVEFYQTMGFDYGMSVDHIILGYDVDRLECPGADGWIERQALTLKLAENFLARHSGMGAKFTPIGVAHRVGVQSHMRAQ